MPQLAHELPVAGLDFAADGDDGGPAFERGIVLTCPPRATDNHRVDVEVIGTISDIETIATGRSIRDLARLKKFYGPGRWRKLKGIAQVRLPDSAVSKAEVHWYEAHGIGKKELKIKRLLGD